MRIDRGAGGTAARHGTAWHGSARHGSARHGPRPPGTPRSASPRSPRGLLRARPCPPPAPRGRGRAKGAGGAAGDARPPGPGRELNADSSAPGVSCQAREDPLGGLGVGGAHGPPGLREPAASFAAVMLPRVLVTRWDTGQFAEPFQTRRLDPALPPVSVCDPGPRSSLQVSPPQATKSSTTGHRRGDQTQKGCAPADPHARPVPASSEHLPSPELAGAQLRLLLPGCCFQAAAQGMLPKVSCLAAGKPFLAQGSGAAAGSAHAPQPAQPAGMAVSLHFAFASQRRVFGARDTQQGGTAAPGTAAASPWLPRGGGMSPHRAVRGDGCPRALEQGELLFPRVPVINGRRSRRGGWAALREGVSLGAGSPADTPCPGQAAPRWVTTGPKFHRLWFLSDSDFNNNAAGSPCSRHTGRG
ncbi:collagen alpha-1(II) chain-like [Falco naumanni]|uniref:collagen alpha-1(II) chain-like n=1 Tax=Falco naumanni TaxID=148594 RepID=UPI001ADE9F2A|nr:collagen alpha-1(II) chain-like [Falco naumanni]